jgi:LPS O-antigen subunit length determinant protein (WzzB/FepE family)
LKNKFNAERDELEKKYKNDEKRLEQQKRDNKTLKEAIQTSTSEVNKLT